VTSTPQLFRLMNELVFVLLGALLAWAAFTGHYYFDPRSLMWLLLAGLLVAYGAVTMVWSSGPRAIAIVRGGSLIIVGLVMLSLAHVILRWVEPMLIFAGAVLALRGVIVALLVLRIPAPAAPVKTR
jgi:hypothetical protein